MSSRGKAIPDGYVDESFVSVGTPLPSLATRKGDAGEFKPIWEQEVVDEKGR
jgi:G patch domain-containing protein 1